MNNKNEICDECEKNKKYIEKYEIWTNPYMLKPSLKTNLCNTCFNNNIIQCPICSRYFGYYEKEVFDKESNCCLSCFNQLNL